MILLATGLLVSLVTVSQVRRTLRPLTALMDGTRRLAARNFDAPLHVKSGDEFEDLANAFNWLTTDLKRQFEQLEAFNLGTLAALARTVDAKSPWTAGHSERVTALAVEVGRELGMPEADLVDLARGGLVHDIGKIATPVEILDKEGALTADEKAIMQRHPERGAQILEPITAYARLLPIVREHHERWDGNGYPRGLAGLEIARTARVLAIADTYDAMQSDRPYRKGLPLHVVLGVITRESGRQFDPDVVRAFERLMARRGGALG
jgi:putative nucleotidyltransferase with HDIG domain